MYTNDQFTGATVGSAQWFAWLQTATIFYYEGQQSTFTARREAKQRGELYWTAYRQIDGEPEALTADRHFQQAGFTALLA